MRVLITNKVHPVIIKGLQEAGFIVDYDLDVNNDSIRNVIQEYTGIIINSKIKADRDLMDRGRKLQFIGRLGSGLEIIDLVYAAECNITVLNSPEGNRNAVAEHAIGMLLALSNCLISGNQEVKNFTWNRESHRGFELSGKTIGIIGFGNTGQALARKLKCWDMSILANDKYLDKYPEEFQYVCRSEVNEIQENCDIISFHLPLTAETKNYCNLAFIEGCKTPPIIVNTSRGQVISTQELISCLRRGKVKAACLDVFENEHTNTHTDQERSMYTDLFAFNQVITSPHVAGWTHESLEKIAQVLLDKILAQNLST